LQDRHITYVLENGDHVGENIRQQMRAARDMGARLSACCLSGTGESLSLGEETDTLHTLNLAPHQLSGTRLEAIRRFRQHLHEQAGDTLVCDQYKAITTAVLATAFPGTPKPRLVALLRGFYAARSRSRRRFYRLFRRRIHAFITLTEAQKAHMLELMPWFDEHHFHVVNNYLDAERLRSAMASRTDAQAALGIGAGPFTFGTVCRFDPYKRLTDLVAAASILREQGHTFRIVIVGDGRERQAIEQQIANANLADFIELTGSIPDAARFMPAFDAFVLPSEGDNFARVFLEARAADLPVVGVYGGGTPEVVGEHGWISERRAPKQLAEALASVMNLSEKQRRSVGQEGANWSRHHFNRERLHQQLRGALQVP
jgi:glycosyltransferase involved in cell wall biosynthesis